MDSVSNMSKRKNLNDQENQKRLKNKMDYCAKFLDISTNLNKQLDSVKFLKKIDYVYNPTVYAKKGFISYVQKYCNTKKKVMFLGMNPGPWGMSQTGVPFGEVNFVKEWLEIDEPVQKPDKEHPLRPIQGFECTKSEVSGKRFWGLIKELAGTPDVFFKTCFVYNYMPLQFINSAGKNLPPTTFKPKEQEELNKIGDQALIDVIILYEVETIVAIGKFAETRAITAINNLSNTSQVKVVCILHPSPQSKAANNWHVDAHKQLDQLGITPYITGHH